MQSRYPLVGLFIVVLLVTACAGGQLETTTTQAQPTATTSAAPSTTETTPPDHDPLEELIAAAQQEGRVVHYAASVETYSQGQAQAFFEEYGIEVEIVVLNAAALAERFSAEAEAGIHVADMTTHTDLRMYIEHPEWWMPMSGDDVPMIAEYPAWTLALDPHCVGIASHPAGVLINTNLVSGENVPETWEDMLDPFWQNRLIMQDLLSSPTQMRLAAVWERDLGIEYLEGLRAQNMDVAGGAIAAAQQTAAGAYYATIGSHLSASSAVRAEGAPVEFILMTNPSSGGIDCVSIPANAPHPNAARLYLNWRLSTEGLAVGCVGMEAMVPLQVEGCFGTPPDWAYPDIDFSDPDHQERLRIAIGQAP